MSRRINMISMAWCKTAVNTLLTHWSYWSFALNYRYKKLTWHHSKLTVGEVSAYCRFKVVLFHLTLRSQWVSWRLKSPETRLWGDLKRHRIHYDVTVMSSITGPSQNLIKIFISYSLNSISKSHIYGIFLNGFFISLALNTRKILDHGW